MDPLIGLVNQIQIIQDQTLAPLQPATLVSERRVVWYVASRGGCGSYFETLPVASHNTKPADPAGQRSADQTLKKKKKAPGDSEFKKKAGGEVRCRYGG